MKLYAIRNLHVGYRNGRAARAELRRAPDDRLILARDIADVPGQSRERSARCSIDRRGRRALDRLRRGRPS